MKIFKFGGAATNSFERIKNLSFILSHHKDEKMLIVISAMGKMTNALEKVVEAYFDGRTDDAFSLFQKVKDYHTNQLKYLVTFDWKAATDRINEIFEKVESILRTAPENEYNFYYDQIVSSGELLSSTLISFFLNDEKIKNKWIDVRQILQTDEHYRDAKLDWETSGKKVSEKLLPLFEENNFIITQGFIAATENGDSTTFGREGSDYTAAIFAELLHAESVTIWKDVNGVMNADPKDFPNAETIAELSFKEVIEMAYYGAQVIHPKTIKPLQNNNIPLFVRSFLDLSAEGTVITRKQNNHLPPMIVYKRKQALVTLQTVDFSFVEGAPLNFLYEVLHELRIKPNLSQNDAITLMICIDEIPEKTEKLASAGSELFEVNIQRGLTLLTIRHYTEDYTKMDSDGILMEQRTPVTIQRLIKA